MVGKILIPEIQSLIDARNFGALRELFAEWPLWMNDVSLLVGGTLITS
jgi:hypothetical protein